MKKQAQRALFLILMALGIFFPRLVLAEELLTVHFLDVGQADAIIVECGGEYLMIDGGNVADSQYIFAFLRNTLQISHLDYIVATHPHEDHIGGIPAALNACSVGTIFSPVADYDSEVFRSLVKYAGLQGVELSIPANGESFLLGDATACFFTTGKEYYDRLPLRFPASHARRVKEKMRRRFHQFLIPRRARRCPPISSSYKKRCRESLSRYWAG